MYIVITQIWTSIGYDENILVRKISKTLISHQAWSERILNFSTYVNSALPIKLANSSNHYPNLPCPDMFLSVDARIICTFFFSGKHEPEEWTRVPSSTKAYYILRFKGFYNHEPCKMLHIKVKPHQINVPKHLHFTLLYVQSTRIRF